jgi:pSer/pThr/pTyr-binding forkhead associated (FHA) protein
MAEDSSGVLERIYPGDGSDGLVVEMNDSDYDQLSLSELVVAVPPGFALPKDKTITISVIEGPSKGLIHRLLKPHVSIGRTRGGADIEIDDQKMSDMHCAVGVKDSIIRLCDLDSHGGTYVEDRRISTAPLEHLSEFRVGSSLLLVTVLPARAVPPGEEVDEFTREKEE